MQFQVQQPNYQFTNDNSKLRQQFTNFQELGLKYVTQGKNLQEQEYGLNLLKQANETLQLWISREQDPVVIKTLQESIPKKIQYYNEVKLKIDQQKANFQNQQDAISVSQLQPQQSQQLYQPQVQSKQQQQQGQPQQQQQQKQNEQQQQQKKQNIEYVTWDDIAGQDEAKQILKEVISDPLEFPSFFKKGTLTEPWKAVLLYGPPGTGKTLLAKACASTLKANFISITGADIVNKFVGESEKNLKNVFENARQQVPAVIFIDECDQFFGKRNENMQDHQRKLLSEFLTQMNGVNDNNDGLLVLAATNYPFHLDEAVQRRFDKQVYVPLPELEARVYLIQKLLVGKVHKISQQEFQEFSGELEGYSGSELRNLMQDAGMLPFRFMKQAKKFLKIQGDNGDFKYLPVDDSVQDPNIIITEYKDLNSKQIIIPNISVGNLYEAKQMRPPRITKQFLEQYKKYREGIEN